MELRERKIAELVERVSEKSNGFKNPPVIMIGGYALRAFVPFSRYSRDCDFALARGKPWRIDKIEKWLSDSSVEAKRKEAAFGFLRMLQSVKSGNRAVKISLDFMEGQVVDRSGAAFEIDEKLISDSTRSMLRIGSRELEVRVPSYQDYFLLKLLAGRPSDVRDIAALIWQNGLPEVKELIARSKDAVTEPSILRAKLETVIADLSHPSFLDSWRGTFITETFTDKAKQKVLRALREFQMELIHAESE